MKAIDLLTKARNERFALGAFNTGNLEVAKAITSAALVKQSPLIMETSAGESEYFGMDNFLGFVKNFREKNNLPILANFDHGPGLVECRAAIEAGFDQVHFDGAKLSYEENIKITKNLVLEAHTKGILIEAEMDRIMGESRSHGELAESVQALGNYTDPNKAAEFVNLTGCDILAVFIGNVHGIYQTKKKLDLSLLRAIRSKVPCFLSLHGGSDLLAEDVKGAIGLGVVKVNINTELRMAFRETLNNVLKGTDEAAVYKIMPPVIAAMQKIVEEKIDLFGSGGKVF